MYELHRLGWNSFQQLCQTICREVLGQTVESFLDSNDAGKDGAFAGTWNPAPGEVYTGRFVIQCKFTAEVGHNLKPSDIKDEIEKVRKLVAAAQCDVYVLMTNSGVSGVQTTKVKTLLAQAGVEHVLVFGSTWINQQIREKKNLRMHVPRMYGLGDLSQILDERAYAQARAVLESMREDLAKVVMTASYSKAVEALNKHGFVMLIGEPAAGKTTIASMLAMAAADKWGSSVLKLNDPAKVEERWNTEEPSQFFWVDDAFGIMQYESSLAHSWNHILPQVRTMLRQGAKIVMTSRDYIYKRARRDLKEGAFPLFNESQVVIDVHDLSSQEKQQILYNHLKLGSQPPAFRAEIKPHLLSVAAHPRFIPEIARRLSDPTFTKQLLLSKYHLGQFVQKREQLLVEVLDGLDKDSLAALALIYMKRDHLESPISLVEMEEDALHRLGSSLGKCINALEAMNGSLVVHQQVDSELVWRFKHPTIGDAFASALARRPDLLGIFLLGSTTENLIEQVTCGDVGIERAVMVPKSLYSQMITRLAEFTGSDKYKSQFLSVWGAKRSLHEFLTHRCSKDFLALYLKGSPELIDRVCEPGLRLDWSSEVYLAVRLHEFGLLPEENRAAFVGVVSAYAVSGEDVSALNDQRIRSVFTGDELDTLVKRVREELLPTLSEVREKEQEGYGEDDRPEEYMEHLLERFTTLKDTFGDNGYALRIIEREIDEARNWISEHDHERPEKSPRSLDSAATTDKPHGSRSIFDDIDI
jgi:energy-coupling factor transporter ATP-binding protein EcfA2